MADMKESALTQQSDCKWVRALDSNGNSILISKEDLASVVGELIGTVTENKNGLATIRMYNCLPKPLVANKTDEYVKICSINHITVGSILYTVGNQDIGIRFCGIIDITASNNSGGNIKIKLTKLSGVMDSVQIYYKKNASGGYDLAIKNPVMYGFHTAISNTYYIIMDSSKFTDIEGWTLVN